VKYTFRWEVLLQNLPLFFWGALGTLEISGLEQGDAVVEQGLRLLGGVGRARARARRRRAVRAGLQPKGPGSPQERARGDTAAEEAREQAGRRAHGSAYHGRASAIAR